MASSVDQRCLSSSLSSRQLNARFQLYIHMGMAYKPPSWIGCQNNNYRIGRCGDATPSSLTLNLLVSFHPTRIAIETLYLTLDTLIPTANVLQHHKMIVTRASNLFLMLSYSPKHDSDPNPSRHHTTPSKLATREIQPFRSRLPLPV